VIFLRVDSLKLCEISIFVSTNSWFRILYKSIFYSTIKSYWSFSSSSKPII